MLPPALRIARCRLLPPAGAPSAADLRSDLCDRVGKGQRGVRRAYPPAKLARLTALKTIWDPRNVFHLNHDIRPHSQ
ncbi:BBE domain-containing protein [Micromonospora arida]